MMHAARCAGPDPWHDPLRQPTHRVQSCQPPRLLSAILRRAPVDARAHGPCSSLSPWSSLREVLQKATQAVAYWCKPYAAVLAFRAVLSRSAILRATPRTPHHPPCQRRITHPAKDASRRAETRKNRPPHVRMCVHHATGLPACRAPLRLWCFPQAGYKEPIKPE